MDRLKTAQDDLKTAQAELTDLQNELPQFFALLTENEADTQRLKTERASLDAQAQAKGRVNIAREMLEQHQSDIQNARAEVARLETAVKRDSALAEMLKQGALTRKHRDDIDTQLQKASKTLEGYTQRCIEVYDSLTAAFHAYQAVDADDDLKRRFSASGGKLANGLNDYGAVFISEYPQPYGGVVWQLVNTELQQRGYQRQTAIAEERRRRAAATYAQTQPKKVNLRVTELDAPQAIQQLGELVIEAHKVGSTEVNTVGRVDISLLADDLEAAKELLEGKLTYGDYSVSRA
jgi:hypothetical protein